MPFLLRHFAVEPDKVETRLLEQRLNQAQHRRPLAEQYDFAIAFRGKLFEQFGKPLELAAVAGCFFVDQKRTVTRHASHEQVLLQAQQVHLGEEPLGDDLRCPLDVLLAH